jgi:hypothetical protein
MGYPLDLPDAADSFLRTEPITQAILRRTVSTAYYALFHLLIEDAANCGRNLIIVAGCHATSSTKE